MNGREGLMVGGLAPLWMLGPPVVPFYHCFGEGSPAKIDYRKGYPYSNLSTGGPRMAFKGNPKKLKPDFLERDLICDGNQPIWTSWKGSCASQQDPPKKEKEVSFLNPRKANLKHRTPMFLLPYFLDC